MLKISDLSFLHYISDECNLYNRVYLQMKRIAGVRRAIYFRLNCSNYHKLPDYDLMFLAILIIELQNPKLDHKYKDDYYFFVKEIFKSLTIIERRTINDYFNSIIYGRK